MPRTSANSAKAPTLAWVSHTHAITHTDASAQEKLPGALFSGRILREALPAFGGLPSTLCLSEPGSQPHSLFTHRSILIRPQPCLKPGSMIIAFHSAPPNKSWMLMFDRSG